MDPLSAAMPWFVIVLTAVWLVSVMVHELRTRRREGKPEATLTAPNTNG